MGPIKYLPQKFSFYSPNFKSDVLAMEVFVAFLVFWWMSSSVFFIAGFVQLDIKVIVVRTKNCMSSYHTFMSIARNGVIQFLILISQAIWKMEKTSNYCFLNFLQLSEMFDKRSCNFQLLQLLPLCPNGKFLQWKKLPTWKHASKIRKISQKKLSPTLNSPNFHGFHVWSNF